MSPYAASRTARWSFLHLCDRETIEETMLRRWQNSRLVHTPSAIPEDEVQMGTETHSSNSRESTSIHSLVLKIWRRNGSSPGAQPAWHGHVTEVPSGDRVYANNPNELLLIVATHLRKLGAQLSICWRLGVWVHMLRRHSDRGTP